MGDNRPVHVVPHGDDWATTREGNQHVSKVYKRQSDAIDAGKPTAQRNQTELIIHNREGEIRERNSYGNDPYPPNG